MRNAKVLLSFMFLLIVISIFPASSTLKTTNIYVDMSEDILNLCLTVLYFKIITNFITEFRLHTKVHEDGNIDIVGIDRNGYEVFKFALDNALKQQWLGTTS